MAAKKTKESKAITLSTAALAHGESAYGARYVKTGFAFTPAMDLAFGLGYPHYVELADGHPADESVEAGLAHLADTDRGVRVWPRGVASRTARAYALLLNAKLRVAPFSKEGAVTADEAREIIRTSLDCNRGDRLLLLLEALVGTDVVLEAAIETMEGYGEAQWTGSDFDMVTYPLGFLLLRVPEAASARARARLEALYDKAKKAGWASDGVNNLDVALHGVEGAERSGYRPEGEAISSMYITHVVDDPEWVAKTVAAGGAPDSSVMPDPRLAFLGGEAVLKAERGWWKKYTKIGAQQAYVEGFGQIRSQTLLPAFLEMTAASKAKKEATAWFVQHADFARSFLEAQAKGKGGDAAKAVLKALG
jgi:hypothetical protein